MTCGVGVYIHMGGLVLLEYFVPTIVLPNARS